MGKIHGQIARERKYMGKKNKPNICSCTQSINIFLKIPLTLIKDYHDISIYLWNLLGEM